MIVKRSLSIQGHRTSISIEDVFWTELKRIASRDNISLSQLVARIDSTRGVGSNLSSALRVFVLEDALDLSSAAEHVGHRDRPIDRAS